MIRYVIRRMAQSAVLLVLVSIAGFAILTLAPGGPLAAYSMIPGMSHEAILRLQHQMGLDQPLPVQYGKWAYGLLIGDWGRSYRDGQPVLSIIASRLPATLQLMIAAQLVTVVVGTAAGILAAVRRYSAFDYTSSLFAMIALSVPTFWFGLMVIFLFAVRLDWIPPGNIVTIGDGSIANRLHHMIAPALVLALVNMAKWTLYTRSSMLDVLNQDYLRTARSKGIGERTVLVRHALRNAVLPLITIAGLQLPYLFAGALVTETVFTWPGMGRLFVDSLGYRDYPVLMGLLMFTALTVLAGSFLADVVYSLIDPRIRMR